MPFDRHKLKEARIKAGLSIYQAGWRAGFALNCKAQWYHIESGNTDDPGVATVQRMAIALGVKVDSLLNRKWPRIVASPCNLPPEAEKLPPKRKLGRPKKDPYAHLAVDTLADVEPPASPSTEESPDPGAPPPSA
jgi:hypothetical protein